MSPRVEEINQVIPLYAPSSGLKMELILVPSQPSRAVHFEV